MVRPVIQVDFKGLQELIRRAQAGLADLRPEMEKIGGFVVRDARERLKRRRGRTGSGRLGRSLQAQAYTTSVVIGSVLPYARIQQEGGVVHPRKRKMLAIPLQEDLARRHVWPKHVKPEQIFRIENILWFIRKRRVSGMRPTTSAGRTVKSAFDKASKLAKRSKKGWKAVKRMKLVKRVTKATRKKLGMKRGTSQKKGKPQNLTAVPGWVLVKSAKIPGRPYLLKSRQLIEFMRKVLMEKLRSIQKG